MIQRCEPDYIVSMLEQKARNSGGLLQLRSKGLGDIRIAAQNCRSFYGSQEYRSNLSLAAV